MKTRYSEFRFAWPWPVPAALLTACAPTAHQRPAPGKISGATTPVPLAAQVAPTPPIAAPRPKLFRQLTPLSAGGFTRGRIGPILKPVLPPLRD